MISPHSPIPSPAVARHYDDLDRFYREIWGEHVHHGLWERGDEEPAEAAVALARLVAARLGARPGDRVCDVGCGYGATARLLAHEHGCDVTALTIAPAQHAHAVAADPMAHNPRYLLRDWLDNGLPDRSFDAVLAIESTEHMADKERCFAEMARVLAPGGRVVVCAWLAREEPRSAEVRLLLEPICREGRLPGMGTEGEYRALMERAGFTVHAAEDLTARVRRTWPVCVSRLVRGLATRADYRAFLLRSRAEDRVFALTMLRIWAAYGTGAMRYVMFVGGRD
ncbi:MAG TPA: methyltransferase domain-containing protein [Gemmatimonadales bacterium]